MTPRAAIRYLFKGVFKRSYISILLLLAGIWIYAHYLAPSALLARKVDKELAAFNSVVDTQDRAKIIGYLQQNMADNATVTIEVSMNTRGAATDAILSNQNFTKPEFIAYVDTLLASLSNYRHTAHIKSAEISRDNHLVNAYFLAQDAADSISDKGDIPVNMHFDSRTECGARITFEYSQMKIQQLKCGLRLDIISHLAEPDQPPPTAVR
jgi:hypothetical protein